VFISLVSRFNRARLVCFPWFSFFSLRHSRLNSPILLLVTDAFMNGYSLRTLFFRSEDSLFPVRSLSRLQAPLSVPPPLVARQPEKLLVLQFYDSCGAQPPRSSLRTRRMKGSALPYSSQAHAFFFYLSFCTRGVVELLRYCLLFFFFSGVPVVSRFSSPWILIELKWEIFLPSHSSNCSHSGDGRRERSRLSRRSGGRLLPPRSGPCSASIGCMFSK